MTITFINLFEVPVGRDDMFRAAWQAAHDEGFVALAGQPVFEEFPRSPTLYEVVHEGAVTLDGSPFELDRPPAIEHIVRALPDA